MENSILLAKIIGPIYLIIAVGMLLNQEHYRAVAKEFVESPALYYVSATLALILGMLIVRFHNVWSGWPTVITLLGWAAIVKGIARTLIPNQATQWITKLVASPNTIAGTAVVALVLGAFLTAAGYGLFG